MVASTAPDSSGLPRPTVTATDDSISNMTQVKPARQFKFVGAYSRKRRKKKAPPKTPPMTPKSPPVNSTGEVQQEPPTPLAGPLPTANEIHPEPVEIPADPMVAETLLHGQSLLDMLPMASTTDPSGMNIDVGNMPDMTDWADSYASLMNPFQDLVADFNAPFDSMAGQYQIPFFPGSATGAFAQLAGSPSTDSSTRTQAQVDEDEPRDEMAGEDMSLYHAMDEITLPPSEPHMARGNISHTISQLLTRYDQEFCVLPLTHDFEANPFRFDPKTGRGSQLLLHCILAISYKHIGRETGTYYREAKTHKKMAFQLLKDVEGDSMDNPVHANFLDAILILMTLDCATSARGPWTWYLQRAHKMIQATESLGVQKSPRVQARIEMLVWWDVTLALTTRRGCVLSESTVLSLLSPAESSEASFYSVSGCPKDLFSYMIRLASYAREYELASTMTCVKFNMDPVLEAGKNIREWNNPRFTAAHENEEPTNIDGDLQTSLAEQTDVSQYKEDLYHCAEAWRYALLLYIERVFKWRNQTASPLLGFLARRTLNHVASCRRSSMLQKQLLLPVFLGGCETVDEDLRQQARIYCQWWNEKSRYDMFLTAGGLLEEIWNTGDSQVWWGSVLDQKARDNGKPSVSRQYLFG